MPEPVPNNKDVAVPQPEPLGLPLTEEERVTFATLPEGLREPTRLTLDLPVNERVGVGEDERHIETVGDGVEVEEGQPVPLAVIEGEQVAEMEGRGEALSLPLLLPVEEGEKQADAEDEPLLCALRATVRLPEAVLQVVGELLRHTVALPLREGLGDEDGDLELLKVALCEAVRIAEREAVCVEDKQIVGVEEELAAEEAD